MLKPREGGKQVAKFRSARARNHLLILREHVCDDPYIPPLPTAFYSELLFARAASSMHQA